MRKKVHLIPVGTLFTSILTVKYVQCVEDPCGWLWFHSVMVPLQLCHSVGGCDRTPHCMHRSHK